MKSYTDISQSKKLVEILPIESVDMQWFLEEDYGIVQIKEGLQDWGGDCTIPCWSLSALLSVLPKLGAEEPSIQKLYYASNPTERYICQYSLTNMTGEYDNPVDACYEMVLLLKEKNLI